MPSLLPCPQKRKLLHDYELAARSLAASIAEITRRLDALDKSKYEHLFRTSQVCYEVVEGTRQRLERHIADHGC
jgi:hypothetical protein